MRLLLDTHVVLWELSGSRQVSRAAEAAIEQATDVLFSVVSFAEIGVKAAVGKLAVPDDLRDRVLASGLQVLGLVAQAQTEQLTLVSADRRLAAYDVRLVDAG